jgi:uncharacterized protein (TIGR03437 family)
MRLSSKRIGGRGYLLLALATALSLAGQTGTVTSVSVGNYKPIVAPGSIVSGWGTSLAATTVFANNNPSGMAITLPEMLGNVRLTVVDAAKTSRMAGIYMVSPGQINYVLPDATAQGAATLTVTNGTAPITGPVLVSNIAPSIFTADGSGKGVPAAQILRVTGGSQATYESPFQTGTSTFVPAPINVAASGGEVYILLYGTGIRRHSLNPVIATIGDVGVPVTYAGAQSEYPGLDQINIGPLPATLAGKGNSELTVMVDGVPANAVAVAIR